MKCSKNVLNFVFTLALAFCVSVGSGAFADVVDVQPVESRSALAKFIGLSPEANSHLVEMVSAAAAADLADQATQLESELKGAMINQGPGYLSKLLRYYADNGVRLERLREAVQQTFGQKLSILIPVHPKDLDKGGFSEFIAEGNRRLIRIGFDFVEFRAVHDVSALPSSQPTPETLDARDRLQRFRSAFVPLVALSTTVLGGFFASKMGHYEGAAFWVAMAPSTFMGFVYAGTEWQFSRFSSWWNKNIWQKLDWKGPLLANALLPAVFYGMALGAQYLTVFLDSALGWNTGVTFSEKSFTSFLQTWFPQFILFQGSTGFFQTALGRLTRRGEMSEGNRFFNESGPAIVGNVGRAAGSSAPFFGEAGKSVEFGAQAFSWSLQLGVFFLATAPSWIKLWYGDANFDATTAEKLGVPSQSQGFCKRVIAGLSLAWPLPKHLIFSKR